MRTIARQVLAERGHEPGFGHPGFWQVRKAELMAVLDDLAVYLAARPREAFRTQYHERELSGEISCGPWSIALHGRVDRVAIREGPCGVSGIVVQDFKYSGNASRYRGRLDLATLGQSSFQLPVYLYLTLQQLARDGSVVDYLLRLRRADGSALWVEVTARTEGEPRTPAWRIEAVMRDVTERRKLQDQTRDLYQQLSQAERLAALGQTMSGVAHELNNPLATILACAERLASQRLEGRTRRDLDAIHNAAERAARIVRNLQTFARKRHTTRTTVDLNQIVRDTLAIRAYEQRAANVLILEALAAGLPPVFADPHQIQQVLLNLLINAEQAMLDAHGRGMLILRSWHDPEHDAVILEVNDDYTMLAAP